ncbi:MAG: hypothetical protein J6F31_08650 [Oscillospiraceae bacterium]|nr:hypothetical protein [Oscillospiraceae bacterium]
MSISNNPLLSINTSFADYLEQRTRSYQEHVVGGTLDYAFDADFALRQKLNGVSGWSRLYKAINSTDIPTRFKKYFSTSDTASSMLFAKAYDCAKKCSDRLQISLPSVLVHKAGEVPEIFSLTGDGIEPTIVLTADIAEEFNQDELCYLIGCECGRLQNRHCTFNYAFTYPGISKGNIEQSTEDPEGKTGLREMNYLLNKWIAAGDVTADRAGIICLDDPLSFPKVFASVRQKGVPDSFGVQHPYFNIEEVLAEYDAIHVTPVRSLKLGENTTPDERRIFAGMEFTGCEILYVWRSDLDRPTTHVSNKQSLEIRCEIIAQTEDAL